MVYPRTTPPSESILEPIRAIRLFWVLGSKSRLTTPRGIDRGPVFDTVRRTTEDKFPLRGIGRDDFAIPSAPTITGNPLGEDRSGRNGRGPPGTFGNRFDNLFYLAPRYRLFQFGIPVFQTEEHDGTDSKANHENPEENFHLVTLSFRFFKFETGKPGTSEPGNAPIKKLLGTITAENTLLESFPITLDECAPILVKLGGKTFNKRNAEADTRQTVIAQIPETPILGNEPNPLLIEVVPMLCNAYYIDEEFAGLSEPLQKTLGSRGPIARIVIQVDFVQDTEHGAFLGSTLNNLMETGYVFGGKKAVLLGPLESEPEVVPDVCLALGLDKLDIREDTTANGQVTKGTLYGVIAFPSSQRPFVNFQH